MQSINPQGSYENTQQTLSIETIRHPVVVVTEPKPVNNNSDSFLRTPALVDDDTLQNKSTSSQPTATHGNYGIIIGSKRKLMTRKQKPAPRRSRRPHRRSSTVQFSVYYYN